MAHRIMAQRIAACLAGALLAALVTGGAATREPTPTEKRAESLAAWGRIAAVLQHPRCLNCHQKDSPLQGDARRPHYPPVVRGDDNLGSGTMRCRNCHNEMGNNEMAGVPGAPRWQLAPESMNWQGLSSGALCNKLQSDPKNWPPEKIAHHMRHDPLVLWGWAPGGNREPVPQTGFAELVDRWVATDAACPP